jgi:hypothetical protein
MKARTGPGWAIALAVLLLVAIGPPAVGAPSSAARAPTTALVQSIVQGPRSVTMQDGLTIGVQVSDPSQIADMYFTFCQITNALCYTPTAMSPNGTGWYSGTTQPMFDYVEMAVGVHAGYNITIGLKNDTNVSEPSAPSQNPFHSLTVVTNPVTSENMFEMGVVNQSYTLSGKVRDAATGAALSGANVSLSPGNGTVLKTGPSGTYSFADVMNGSYGVEVSRPGYLSSEASVTVKGGSAVANLALTNASKSVVGPTPSNSSSPAFFSTLAGEATGAAIVLVLIAVAAVALLMRRRRTAPPKGPETAGEAPGKTPP